MTGEELKKIRRGLGLTQKKMGHMLGFRQPLARMWEMESGRYKIQHRTALLARIMSDNPGMIEQYIVEESGSEQGG